MQDAFLRLWCDARNRWHEIRTDQRGATAVEYGIMVALIAAVIILAVKTIGKDTNAAFEKVGTELPDAP